MAEIIAALPAGMSDWEIAVWFTTSNGWLDDDTPAERLGARAAAVAAAQHEAEEFIG